MDETEPGLIEQAFAVTRADGKLSVTHMPIQKGLETFHPEAAQRHGFVEKDGVWARELTTEIIEAELNRVCEALGTSLVSYRALTPDETASYFEAGEFRGDHVDTGKALKVDVGKARERVRARIRGVRAERFVALDNAMKPLLVKAALGTLSAADKLAMSGIEAQRQTLRDAPADPAIATARTVDDLKAHLDAWK